MRQSIIRQTIFTALDGEGIDSGRNHYYNLLVARCNDLDIQAYYLPAEPLPRLTTWDVFYFLMHRLYNLRQTTFVMFYFSYDVTKWLEDISTEDRETLFHTGKVVVQDPLREIVYEVQYMPNKIFRLTHYYQENGKTKHSSITIYDVFGFFQKSFVKALKDWSIEDSEFIAEMKQKRGTFQQSDIKNVLRYTLEECSKLCQLMNKVRDALYAENLFPKSWHGAGAIAKALFEREHSQNRIRIPAITDSPDLHEALLGSYFGGRFELFRKGIFPRTYQYDINSAYPYAMSQLPDFTGCTIQFNREYTRDKYSIWFVRYNVLQSSGKRKIKNYYGTETFLSGPLPYRTKQGNILFPYFNPYGVWIHQIELQTVMALYGAANFDIVYGYSIKPRTTDKAFPFIEQMAARRLALKEKGDNRNIVLKLALNSLYGKTAEGQRNIDYIPPYQNYYIAGFITAYTRATLLRESFQCGIGGSGIISFATDGIFATKPHRTILESSAAFGQWEFSTLNHSVLYLQAGVYYSEEKAAINKRRTRGFHADSLDAATVFRIWKQFCDTGEPTSIHVSEKRFVGIGTCLVNNSYKNYGRFIEQDRILSLVSPDTKLFSNPGDTPVTGSMAWDTLSPKFYGMEREEIIRQKYNYVMIPDPDFITETSKLYTPPKMKELPLDIQAQIKRLIQNADQPDYDEPVEINEF